MIVHEDEVLAWGWENIISLDHASADPRLTAVTGKQVEGALLNVCVLQKSSDSTIFVVQVNVATRPIWKLTSQEGKITCTEKLMSGMWTLLGVWNDLLIVQPWYSHDLVAFRGSEEVRRIELKGRADTFHFVGDHFYHAYEDANSCRHIQVIDLNDGTVEYDVTVADSLSLVRFIPVIKESQQ